MDFKGQHILSVSQFDRASVEKIIQVADQMQPYANRSKLSKLLEGAILGNMFFEPSTRTRVSFGCAFNKLGGHVRETVGIKNSALAKGESLKDTAMVMSGYSDIIVMRHPLEGSVADFAKRSRVPVINAGDGTNEHPSQALLDLYTMSKELQRFDRSIDSVKIAMVGDLQYGRTVHSLSRLLCLFDNISFSFISPKQLSMPSEIIEQLRLAGHTVVATDSLELGLADVDIVYQTRIQEERFPSKKQADAFRGAFRINRFSYSQFCQASAVIMHPLPRDSREEAKELDEDLDQHPNLAIFRQADNGVLVRMALFALIFGLENQLTKTDVECLWKSDL